MSGWHRWLRLSAGGALLLIVGLCLLGAARISNVEALAIHWIEVEGPFERVTAEQVRTAVVPLLERGFIAVDPELVRETVEHLPWVRSARVTKRWPDTVSIHVLENRPVGRWEDGRLVSDSGRLFRVEERFPANGLPEFGGSEEHAADIVDFYRMMQLRLAGTGLDVRALRRSPRGSWRAGLSGGVEMELGSEEPLQRLVRFVAAINRMEIDAANNLRRVDLRYGNGFAVRWADQDGQLIATGGGE